MDARSAPEPSWTAREREVFDLVARGCTNGEIAERLGITFATAKWHVGELISKLGVESREELALYWAGRRRQSLQRTVRSLLGFGSLRVAAGVGGVATLGVVAAIVLAVVLVRSPAGPEIGSAQVVPVVPTPTPTPVPAPERPQPPAGNLRPYTEFPALVALDRGGCDFEGVNFSQVEAASRGSFTGIALVGCNLRDADFTGVGLNDADLSGSDLRGATFRGATLGGANLNGVDARGANLDAVLAGARFRDANLEGASVRAIQVDSALFSNTICPDRTNSDAHGFTCLGTPGVVLIDPSSPSAAASGPRCGDVRSRPPGPCPRADYPVLAPGATAMQCSYADAKLATQELHGVDFRECDLTGASLVDAGLLGAWFDGAKLSKANLHGAALARATFAGADLSGADLTGALLASVNFRGANLAGAALSRDFLDSVLFAGTTCPDGSSSDIDDGDGGTCFANLLP